MKYDYAETKDLLKSALTLISGVLVISVTFGDKVVGLRGAASNARSLLVASWIGFVGAFVAAGIGLSLIAMAAGMAIYGRIPVVNFQWGTLSLAAWLFTVTSGFLFVASLGAMVASAVIAMQTPPVGNEQHTS